MLEQINTDYLEFLKNLAEEHPDSVEIKAIRKALPGIPLDDYEVIKLEFLAHDLLYPEAELLGNDQLRKYYIKFFPYYEAMQYQRRGLNQRLRNLLDDYNFTLRSLIREEAYLEWTIGEDVMLEEETANSNGEDSGSQVFGNTQSLEAQLQAPTLEVPELSPEETTTETTQTPVSIEVDSTGEAQLDTTLEVETPENPGLEIGVQQTIADPQAPESTPEFDPSLFNRNNLELEANLRDTARAIQAEQEASQAEAETIQQNQEAYRLQEEQRQEQLRQARLRERKEEEAAREQELETPEDNYGKRAIIASLTGTSALIGGGIGLSILDILL